MEPFLQSIFNHVDEKALKPLLVYNVDWIREFGGGWPNLYHRFIVEMVSRSKVDAVLTTNFDTMIEVALIQAGLEEDTGFRVAVDDEDFKLERDIPTIFKLHGTVNNPHSMIALLSQVGKGLGELRSQLLREVMEKYHVCIIGWSDNDFDITPVLRFPTSNTVIWIKHTDKQLSNRVEEWLFNHKHLVVNHSLLFIKQLWSYLLDVPIPEQDDVDIEKVDWKMKKAIDTWGQELPTIQRKIIIARLLDLYGKKHTALECYTKVLPQVDEADIVSRAIVLNQMGMMHYYLGEYTEAEHLFNSVREISEPEVDANLWGHLLDNLGIIYRTKGDLARAERTLRDGLKIVKGRNLDVEGALYGNLGDLYIDMGNYREAEVCYHRDIEISDSRGNAHRAAMSRDALGDLMRRKGDYDGALAELDNALMAKERISDMMGIGVSHMNIGNVHHDKGDLVEAENHYSQAMEVLEAVGDQHNVAGLKVNIGIIKRHTGDDDLQESTALFREAEDDFNRLGEAIYLAMVRHEIAKNLNASGHEGEAIDLLSRIIDDFEQSPLEQAGALKTIGISYLLIDDIQNAKKVINQALEVLIKAGMEDDVLECEELLASLDER